MKTYDDLRMLIVGYFAPFCSDAAMANRLAKGLIVMLDSMGYEIKRKKK